MTARHLMTLTILLVLADAVVAGSVFLAVSVIRFQSDPSAVWSVGISPGAAAITFALVWVTTCWLLGLYRLRVRWSLLAEVRDVFRATAAAAAVSLSVLFVLHQDNVSRVFLALLFVVQPLAAIGIRAILRGRFETLGRQGRTTAYMLIAGTGALAEEFANRVEDHQTLGIRVIGHLNVPELPRLGDDGSYASSLRTVTRPVLGQVDELAEVLRMRVVDEVAVCLSARSAHFLEPIVAVAAEHGKTVRVPRDPEETVLRDALSEEFDGFLVRSVVHDGQREAAKAIKRIVDLVGAVLALVVLSPVIAGTALAIRLRDGRPVIFKQVRIGLHGRQFTIYKFRTMDLDAETRFADVAPLSDTRGPAFKMKDDPRVTGLGRIIRRWTLDELPQLINVLKGDMSLVGPRPAPPREVDGYDIWHRRRLSVRPGMTGLWQVEARFDDHFDNRAVLDLRYIDQWSLWMDFTILLRTIPAVLAPKAH